MLAPLIAAKLSGALAAVVLALLLQEKGSARPGTGLGK